jgi:hypothetical protein
MEHVMKGKKNIVASFVEGKKASPVKEPKSLTPKPKAKKK